jgi:hypothetical protein
MLNAEVEKQLKQLQSDDAAVQGRALAMITVLFSRCENDSQVTEDTHTKTSISRTQRLLTVLCHHCISWSAKSASACSLQPCSLVHLTCQDCMHTPAHSDTHMLPLCRQ